MTSDLSCSASEDVSIIFFNNLKNNDVIQVRQYCRSLDYSPWEFIDTGGLTGKFYLLLYIHIYNLLFSWT